MKIFPSILAGYKADYQRERYGKMFLILLLVCGLLLTLLSNLVQKPFSEVLTQAGQVVSVSEPTYEIVFDIPPYWVTKVMVGSKVQFIDNDLHRKYSSIVRIEQTSNKHDVGLKGYINCQDCQLVFSQMVELHIVAKQSTVLEFFLNTFTNE